MTKIRSSDSSMIDDRRGSGGGGGGGGFPGLGGGGFPIPMKAGGGLLGLVVLLAALFISTIIPIVLFLIFQRLFLRSAGLSGAVKG